MKEVDAAIERKAFRVLGLLSKASIEKENPSNERTKAVAVGKKLGIDNFLITLNVDGLGAAEIPWTLSEKSYVPFCRDWAAGLAQLLKTLRAIEAPCDPNEGRELVRQWLSSQDQAPQRKERLWTNLLPIKSIPGVVRLYEIHGDPDLRKHEYEWAFAFKDRQHVWSFTPPPIETKIVAEQVRGVSWADISGLEGDRLRNSVRFLLRRNLEVYCIRKGMHLTPDGELFFPRGLLENEKIFYQGVAGKRTYIKAVGTHTFRVSPEKRDTNYHHLSPGFSILDRDFSEPVIQFVNRLYLTEANGQPVHATRRLRRRKKICKNWWNDKLASRMHAFASWLADGKEVVEIVKTQEGGVYAVGGRPVDLSNDRGIFEKVSSDLLVEDIPDDSLPVIDDFESGDPLLDHQPDLDEGEVK